MIDVTDLVGTVPSGLSALVIEDVEDACDSTGAKFATTRRPTRQARSPPKRAKIHNETRLNRGQFR